MPSIAEMIKRLEELQKRGKSTNHLRKMKKEDLVEYENDLSDFLSELETIPEENEDPEKIKRIKIDTETLKDRLEKENWRRGWRGFFGFSQPKKQSKDELPSPTAPQKELDRFNEELRKIQRGRQDKASSRYEPNQFPSESRGILTSAIDEFRHALIPPLLDSDITELQRKRDALDAAKAIQQVYKLDGKNIKGVLEKIKSVSTGAASVLGEFVEETTGGVLKASTLFLAWPLILPVKLLNQAFTGAKYGFSFVDGVFGFLDKGFDGLFGKLERTESGKIKVNFENIVKGVAHTLVRGPILFVRGLCQVASIGCRWLEKNIDADKWLKRTPVTAGFAVGGVGAAVLIALVLASIPGLGIPIAIAAVAFAVATVGALVQGYFKGKEKAKELSTLELNPSEATQLEKYEYEHQHKPGITGPSAEEVATKKKTETQKKEASTEKVHKTHKHHKTVIPVEVEEVHLKEHGKKHHHPHHKSHTLYYTHKRKHSKGEVPGESTHPHHSHSDSHHHTKKRKHKQK